MYSEGFAIHEGVARYIEQRYNSEEALRPYYAKYVNVTYMLLNKRLLMVYMCIFVGLAIITHSAVHFILKVHFIIRSKLQNILYKWDLYHAH